jgi:hypothetical protein
MAVYHDDVELDPSHALPEENSVVLQESKITV